MRAAPTPDLVARAALVSLKGVGPTRSRWLLGSGVPATEVVAHLRDERLPPGIGAAPPGVTAKLVQDWSRLLRCSEAADMLAGAYRQGFDVIGPEDDHWPYAEDPDPPSVLFSLGDLDLMGDSPLVAVVGTRRCSTIGRRVAFGLGAELAEAGVVVVSGLAAGVDAAAHQGALSVGGRPLGVVGTGLDVVYPTANRRLWHQVATNGLLISEAFPGTKPERWRFPARNRLMAGLADIVVIVESHDQGGSLHTVNEALERGCPVLAVPGSVTSPAAAGTNQLLVDGCPPARNASDVLDVLGLFGPPEHGLSSGSGSGSGGSADGVSVDGLSAFERSIVNQAAAAPVHLDDLLSTVRATIPEILATVNALVERGTVELDGSTVSLPAPT